MFIFCLLQLYYVLLLCIELHGFNLAINRHNRIAIGRQQTRLIAINKVSTDAIIIFYIRISEGAANHNTCSHGEKFLLFYAFAM